MSKRLKRLVQLMILAGIAAGHSMSPSAAPITCDEFFESAEQDAATVCGGPPSAGECDCLETDEGIISAECTFFCN